MKLKKITKKLNILINFHIRDKIIIIFIAFGLIPMLIVSFVQLTMMTRHLQTSAINQATFEIEQMAKKFDEKVYNYYMILNSITDDLRLRNYLSKEYKNLGYAVDLYYYIYNTNASIRERNNEAELFIYTINEDLITTKVPNVIYINNIIKTIDNNSEINDFINPYLSMESFAVDEESKNYISVKQLILEPHSYTRPIGMAALAIDEYEISKLLKSDNQYTTVLIVDKDNNVIYSSDSGIMYEPSDIVTNMQILESIDDKTPYYSSDEKKYYLMKKVCNQLRIVTILSQDSLNAPVLAIQRVVIIIIFITTILAILMVAMLSSITGNRLNRLLDKFNISGNEMPEPGEPIIGKDEIGILDKDFRIMTDKLKIAVNNLYMAQQEKHEAQLLALQNQINPHFLYNVLSDIGWMTQTHSTEEVRNTINMVASYYRAVHSGGRDVITLEEELNGIKAYTNIQNIRSKGRMKARIMILHPYTDILIPKMSLQPIIENSFEHGIDEKHESISVLIMTYVEDEFIYIEISDNGSGIILENIDEIQTSVVTGYGIRNVQSRLKLYYGDSYEFKMENCSEGGCKTTIKIPVTSSMDI